MDKPMMKFKLGEVVNTPHGSGKVIAIEANDRAFNSVPYDSPIAVDWRYGVEHSEKPKGFNYSPLYYYSREINQ